MREKQWKKTVNSAHFYIILSLSCYQSGNELCLQYFFHVYSLSLTVNSFFTQKWSFGHLKTSRKTLGHFFLFFSMFIPVRKSVQESSTCQGVQHMITFEGNYWPGFQNLLLLQYYHYNKLWNVILEKYLEVLVTWKSSLFTLSTYCHIFY